MKIDLDKLLELYGPYKKCPLAFVEYPQINELLDAIPQLCLELKAAREVVSVIKGSKDMSVWSRPELIQTAVEMYDEVTGES